MIGGTMKDQPAEQTSVTAPTVKEGLGYPNDRQETSPTPVGWQGLDTSDITHVSRETSQGR
jgi:hypothetical protein